MRGFPQSLDAVAVAFTQRSHEQISSIMGMRQYNRHNIVHHYYLEKRGVSYDTIFFI